MKKIYFTIAIFILSLNAFAQIGITAGLNLAKYSYSEESFNVERKSLMSYNFGIQYKKSLSEKFYLLPELEYTVKGANVYMSYPIGETGPMKNTNKLNYLQLTLPVMGAFALDDEGTYDFEIGLGPYAGYLLSAKQKVEEFDGSTSESKFSSDALKRMDYGLQFSTGFRMSKQLGLHFKYDLGLANIEPESGNPAIKTRNFSINLSWIFSGND